MVQHECSHCHQIFTAQDHSGDYVHQCNSNQTALDKEDYVDYNRKNLMISSLENGANTRARLEGEDIKNRNSRGRDESVFSERQHYEYIDKV